MISVVSRRPDVQVHFDDRWESVSCPVCGQAESSIFLEGIAPNGLEFRLVKCAACDLVYLNPRPSLERLMDYYPPDYGAHEAPNVGLRQKLKLLALRANQRQSGIKGAWQAWPGRRLKPLLGLKVEYIPGGRILDVGCGNGLNVWLYQQAGWEAVGVEPADSAASIARSMGLRVYTGTLDQVRFSSSSLDVVTMYQVLEHVPNPRMVLDECRRILRPGGRLLISVANIECYDLHLFGSTWFPLEVPRHLCHFSVQTLSRLLQESGFRVSHVNPQYLLFRATLNDFRKLYAYLRAQVSAGYLSRREASGKLVVVGIQGFLVKPLRFLVASKREQQFAYFLNLHATRE